MSLEGQVLSLTEDLQALIDAAKTIDEQPALTVELSADDLFICRLDATGQTVKVTYTQLLQVASQLSDSQWVLFNTADISKKLQFDLSAISTGNTRIISMPDRDISLSGVPVSIEDFGAKGDAVQLLDFDITGDVLSSPSAVFTADDVTKIFSVADAGAAGEHLIGTIIAYISPTSVQLSITATTNVTGKMGSYGTDNIKPLQEAGDYAILNNLQLYAPEGTYLIGDYNDVTGYNAVRWQSLPENANFVFKGAGKGLTVFRELDGSVQREGAFKKIFYIYLNSTVDIGNIHISDMTFDKNFRSMTINPVSYYSWDQSHCFGIAEHVSNYNRHVRSIVFENIEIYDKTGAGISASSATRVGSALLNNITEKHTSYRRSDLEVVELGTWNASTNTPDILTSTVGINEDEYYRVTTAGTQIGYAFDVGDRIRFNGTDWVATPIGRLVNPNGNIILGQRADIEMSLFSNQISADNCQLAYMQIEPVVGYKSTKEKGRQTSISNSSIHSLEFTEDETASSWHSVLKLTNVTSKKLTVRTLTLYATNCDLMSEDVISVRQGSINNCLFRLQYFPETNIITSLDIGFLTTISTVLNRVTINNCAFRIDDENPAIVPSNGFAIKSGGKDTDGIKNKIIVTGCTFDERLYGSISAYGTGDWLITNNRLAGNTYALQAGANSVYYADVRIKNNDYSLVTGKSIDIQNQNALWTLAIDEVLPASEWWVKVTGSVGNIETQIKVFPTLVIDDIANMANYQIKGTRAKITQPTIGEFAEYICTVAGTSGTWVGISKVGGKNIFEENILKLVYPTNAITTTSGTLVIGKRYVIYALLATDDFSNCGYVAVNTVFVATATTPTVWTNSTVVYNLTDSAPVITVLRQDSIGTFYIEAYENFKIALKNDSSVFTSGSTFAYRKWRNTDPSITDEDLSNTDADTIDLTGTDWEIDQGIAGLTVILNIDIF